MLRILDCAATIQGWRLIEEMGNYKSLEIVLWQKLWVQLGAIRLKYSNSTVNSFQHENLILQIYANLILPIYAYLIMQKPSLLSIFNC